VTTTSVEISSGELVKSTALAVDALGRRMTRPELMGAAQQTIERAAVCSSNWIVSDTEDKWRTLSAIAAGIEMNASVLFAGPAFDVATKRRAVSLLPGSGATNSAAFLTSGSTGRPKLVIHQFEALVSSATKMSTAVAFSAERIHHLFPPNYMAGVLNCSVLSLVAGECLCLDGAFAFQTPLQLQASIVELQSSVAWLSPRMMAAIVARMRNDEGLRHAIRKHWRTVVSATGPLSTSTRNQFMDLTGVAVLNTYGTTEHMFISAERCPTDTLTCGRLLDEVTGVIRGGPLAPLSVSSPTTAQLVIDLETGQEIPPEPGSQFPKRPTGDMAAWVGDLLVIGGRSDDLMIVDGMNVAARWYEEVAMEDPRLLDAYCFAITAAGESHLALAGEVTKGTHSADVERDLRVLLASRLTKLPAVRVVKLSEAWPKTASGKLDRASVVAMVTSESDA
jgi:acyl-coenzyme A synthetase/AMP-(fatty) acid ligase